MKKVLALLALALATLPSLALSTRRVEYGGYRIGDSDVLTNETRVSDCPFSVTDASQDPGKSLSAEKVNGQKIVQWWAYSSASYVPQSQAIVNGSIVITPASTNYNGKTTIATGGYSLTWTYNTVGYSPAYLVVDYDWITYNLIYNANGGSGTLPSSLSGIIYTNNVTIVSDSLPARTGYTWSGWTNNLTTTVWQGGETVTGESLGLRSIVDGSNVVLRAKWVPHTYTINFNKNTSDIVSGTMEPQAMTYDVSANLTSNAFVRTGYKFKGWATAADGAKIYNDGQRVESLTDEDNGVVTLYAIWESKKFSIRYHRNDGTDTTSVQDNLSYGTPVKIVSTTSRGGYIFMGWATSPDGDVDYESGQEYSIDPGDDDVFHLYAIWNPKRYQIKFNSNGGSGTMTDAEVEYGEVYVIPECDYTKSGVSFTGWTTNLAAVVEFHAGQSVSNLTTKTDGVVTFYAVWSEPRYIAFDGNGADNPDAMDIVAFDGIETNALPQCEFAKTGYTFGGWATNAVAATNLVVAYKDKADVISTNLWMAIGETNVFYAVWQTNLYTVVFNANGGAGEMEDQTFCYDQGQALSKCAFTSSLMFMGWATNETDSAVYADGEVVTNLTAEAGGVVNLYAVWNNGDLSKAMHCDNLVWISSGKGTEWEAVEGSAQGYNGSGSAAKVSVAWSDTGDELYSKELSVDPLLAGSTSGKLSFWYKTGSIKSDWYSISIQNGDDLSNVELSKNWKQYGPVFVDNISGVKIRLQILQSDDMDNGDSCTVYIDQMKWVPGGAEPTEDDRPTINGFTAKDGGFALSVDGGNISDLFSYQILATNELVKGDWPVKETLTADELKAGYEIGIEENEPKMFYKVNVVPKQ